MDALYTSFLSDSKGKELEWRIPINKSQYDNVLRFLRDSHTGTEHPLDVTLNIIMGKNIRMSIQGSQQIEHYCARDFVPIEHWDAVTIGTKSAASRPILNPNGSRLSLSNETEENFKQLVLNPDMLTEMDANVKAIVQESQLAGNQKIDLKMYRKLFRLRQRRSFTIGKSLRVDITMVKENASIINLSDKREIISTLTMKEANLGKQPLSFELEVELLEAKPEAVEQMKQLIQTLEKELTLERVMMSSLVQNFYRQSIRSLVESHFQYLSETMGTGGMPSDAPKTLLDATRKYTGAKRLPFIVPKLVSMTQNDLPIQDGMTVTDKADGDACIIMVIQNRIYIFDSSLRLLMPERLLGADEFPIQGVCLFAGEFIHKDRAGLPHNTAYIYDCYLWNAGDVRRLNLMSEKADEPTRIRYVNELERYLKPNEAEIGDGLRIRAKKMYLGDMMEMSEKIWKERNNFPYILDGLIFTPAYTPVAGPMAMGGAGGGVDGENNWEWGYRMDRTWKQNLKWKPPEYNSVDFILVWTSRITKGLTGLIRKGELRTTETVEQNGVKCTVFPLFQPTEYVKPKAYQIEVPIDAGREPRTEEGNEYIRNNSIVECRYDIGREQWIVLRNREDKTKAWDGSLDTLKSARFKLKKLVDLATQHKHSGDWRQTVLRNIHIMARQRVAEQKLQKFNSLKQDLIRFLKFHSMITKSEMEDAELVSVCKKNTDRIYRLLEDPFVPIPLSFGIAGSNNTFVANTIWKSIHEPVRIVDFNSVLGLGQGASESKDEEEDTDGNDQEGGDDQVIPNVTKQVVPGGSSVAFPGLPMKREVNQQILQYLVEQTKEAQTERLMLVGDNEASLRPESMLWTSKEGLRKAGNIIRGDARKFKTGWSTKDDRTTWENWHKGSHGATHLVAMGITGKLENARQRKGLIESLTKSAAVSGSRLYLIYWDIKKISALDTAEYSDVKIPGDDVVIKAKRTRTGHLIVKGSQEGEEYIFYSWSDSKFLTEYVEAGWKIQDDTPVGTEFEKVASKDPLGYFMTMKVLAK